MYCFDWDDLGDQIEIWGTENDPASFQQFQFLLTPCNYIHQQYFGGDSGDFIADECIPDFEKQKEYLG